MQYLKSEMNIVLFSLRKQGLLRVVISFANWNFLYMGIRFGSPGAVGV